MGNLNKTRTRSPAYPYVNLESAIQRAKVFYQKEGRNAAPLAVTSKHWGYEVKSSSCAQTAAALIAFGLMEDESKGDSRRLRLTQNALTILLETWSDAGEKADLIKRVALAPRIHQLIWGKWGAGISDENLRHELIVDWEPRFNENSVDRFIKEYRDTIAYANLVESDIVSSEDRSSDGGKSVERNPPTVGDYVQWESQGIEQFREPKRVTALSIDGTHAFVDGGSTGVPVVQLIRKEATWIRSSPAPPQPPFGRSTVLPTTTVQEDVYSLPEGRIVIQWPSVLSPGSIQDIRGWLKLVERKIARSHGAVTERQQRRRPAGAHRAEAAAKIK